MVDLLWTDEKVSAITPIEGDEKEEGKAKHHQKSELLT